MTEITQADRDAAARVWAEDNDEPLDCHICEQIRAGYGDNSLDVIRFARHRMEERAAIVDIVKGRIDIINGFINGLADNKIKVPDELFSALVELRSLLRELQGA